MRPPIRLRASSTRTSYPSMLRSRAAANPAIPAPMTMTSTFCRVVLMEKDLSVPHDTLIRR
jgi:hypothetical protein